MHDRPKVSVIIPVHAGDATLERALGSVAASDYPDFEIIATNDGGSETTRAILNRHGVKLVEIPRSGPAAARNRAIAEAQGEILYFTDADVEIFPDTISRGVAYLTGNTGLSAVFGSYTPKSGPPNFFSRYKNYVHHFTHQNARCDASTFWTGCGFVRRSAYDAVNGFDEGQRFLSDVEFGYRLHLAGHRIHVAKEIQVIHHKHYDLEGLLRSDFYGRAIPWSRLLARHRTLRSDLNLKGNNVASVFVSYLLLLGLLPALFTAPVGIMTLIMGFGLLTLLNRAFLDFVRQEEDVLFAIGTLVMQWVIYLISGAGVVAAALGHRSGGR